MKYGLPHNPTRRHLGPYLSPWYVTINVKRSVDLGRVNNHGIVAQALRSVFPRLKPRPKGVVNSTGFVRTIFSNRPR